MTQTQNKQSKLQQIVDKIKQAAKKRIKEPMRTDGMKQKKVILHD
jgi:ribosomal silencing factor RsfS